MYQNKAKQVNFGTGVEYHFNDTKKTIASIGGWYRVNDAPIISASIEYSGIRMGVSYDVNTSALQPASSNRGAFEISLIYIGKIESLKTPVQYVCPRL